MKKQHITRERHSHARCSHSCDRAYQRGWSRYTFFCILLGQGWNVRMVKQLTAEIHHSQMIKSLLRCHGQDFLTLVAAVTTALMGVSPPCNMINQNNDNNEPITKAFVMCTAMLGSTAPVLLPDPQCTQVKRVWWIAPWHVSDCLTRRLNIRTSLGTRPSYACQGQVPRLYTYLGFFTIITSALLTTPT